MSLTTVNPATGQVIKQYQEMDVQEVDKIIEQSHTEFLDWSKQPFAVRAKPMHRMAEILQRNKEKYAPLLTSEMGKTLKSAADEIEKCAWVCRYFADNAEKFLQPRMILTEMSKSYVAFPPLGVVFAIMPWNFPFWQVFRFAAPAVMAGNSGVLRHAEITTGCGLEIETIFKEAGFPENIFRTLLINNDTAGKVIKNPHVAAVTLTGSNRTGQIVGSEAGDALKKIVLELGGNDAYIILEDADLNLAAEAAVASRMNNSGQSCIAAKRFLAVDPIREKFEKLVLEKVAKYKMGNPTDENIQLGPLARKDLRDTLQTQVDKSVAKGAKIVLGGKIPEEPGFYYPPTVLTQVKKGMPAYDEELFGPVITFIDVKDEDEALTIAADTKFGLSAAVFTQNISHGEKLALEKIHAGSVFVNDFVRSDPRLPFGGIKGSGYGRELSEEGIREFVNVKTIAIK